MTNRCAEKLHDYFSTVTKILLQNMSERDVHSSCSFISLHVSCGRAVYLPLGLFKTKTAIELATSWLLVADGRQHNTAFFHRLLEEKSGIRNFDQYDTSHELAHAV
jgi:hypothetical protein